LHGYQGNELSFKPVADDVFARFKAVNIRTDYSAEQGSLAAAAANTEIDINDIIHGHHDTEHNFIIAHSMGGLVARTLGQMIHPTTGAPYYNGLITFGTPHQGVFAANTLVENPQQISNALTNACQKLAIGPVKEGINNTGALGSLAIMFGFGGGILNYACEAGVGYGFPALVRFVEQGVEAEMTTSAAAAIPDMPTDHKAVFYGREHGISEIGNSDGTLTPRFIGALLNDPSTFPLYGADASDALGIAEVASQLDFYVTKMNFWQNLHNELCPGGFLSWCWSNAKPIAIAYKEGVDWFPTLDPTWQELIGARETNIVQWGCYYWNEDWYYGQCTEYLGYDSNCDPSYSYDCEEPAYGPQLTIKQSDGFILEESAMNGPGMNYDVQFMDGSNHMQMRNDSNMEDAIKKIFRDGIEEGKTFFRTPER